MDKAVMAVEAVGAMDVPRQQRSDDTTVKRWHI